MPVIDEDAVTSTTLIDRPGGGREPRYLGERRLLLTAMGIHEEVQSYSVSTFRNDLVAYRRVLRLTTVTGGTYFLAFPDTPPVDWLQFVGSAVNVFLPAADFDATYRVLRAETPVFVTALTLFGTRAFSLDSGVEAPGQGAADPQELVDFMAQAAAGPVADEP